MRMDRRIIITIITTTGITIIPTIIDRRARISPAIPAGLFAACRHHFLELMLNPMRRVREILSRSGNGAAGGERRYQAETSHQEQHT